MPSLFEIILAVALIVTFFVMAARLGSINSKLEYIFKALANSPANRIQITCSKCSEKFDVSPIKKGELLSCPKCKELNRV